MTSETLPLGLQQQLQQRWATPFQPPGAYRIGVHISALPSPPPGPARQASLSTGLVEIRLSGTQVWIGAGLHLHVEADHTHLTARPEVVTEAEWLLAFSEAHRASGWVPLHAATVAHGGAAVAISGVSGAGKSTAALSLGGAGLQILAEDQSWVHSATGDVVGLDRFLRAFPDSVRRVAPERLHPGVLTDTDGKLLLPLELQRQPAQLQAMLVFGLPPRARRADVVRVLWEMTGVPLTPKAQQRTAQAISILAQRLPIEGTDRANVEAQVMERVNPPTRDVHL